MMLPLFTQAKKKLILLTMFINKLKKKTTPE